MSLYYPTTKERPEAWKDDAACRDMDPELFEPNGRTYAMNASQYYTVEQRAFLGALCNSCAVKSECRDYADAGREWGWWAGTTETERIKARRKRDAA